MVVRSNSSVESQRWVFRFRLTRLLTGLFVANLAFNTWAALQFDVFPGYDGVVPEAAWFPIMCEIKNDGPAFNGVIELNGGSFNQSQAHKVEVELPTGTLKRVLIPVFSTANCEPNRSGCEPANI